MKLILTILLIFFSVRLTAQIVALRPVFVMDWAGYSTGNPSEQLGGNAPQRWFDGNGNPNSYNPGITTLATDSGGYSTAAIPYRGTWEGISAPTSPDQYRGRRGIRILFDFVGDTNMFNLQKVRFSEVYGLQLAPQNEGYKDTLFLYNFDTVFTKPVSERWKYIARPDSLLTPFARLVSGSPIFYYLTWAHDSFPTVDCRYVLARMKYYDHGGGWTTLPDFRELVFYGTKLYAPGDVTLRPSSYAGALPKAKPLKNILGTNSIGSNADQYFNDGLVRFYQKIEAQYDRVSVPFSNPTRVYNFNFYGFNSSQWNSELMLRDSGILVHSSIRGNSKYVADRNGGYTERINTTEPFQEPEDPNNYFSDAHFFRSYAKLWGNNQDSSHYSSYRISNTSQIPGPPVGKNHYYGVEPGNENEFRGESIPASVMRAIAYWDGWEGRLSDAAGPLGIKSADPNFKVIMPGRIFMDSNFVASFIFLSRLMRSDHAVCFDIANFHHYPRTYNSVDHSTTYEEQVNGRGRTPEQDRMYERVTRSIRQLYNFLNGDTTKKFYLSEYGYDNYATPPTTVAQLSFGPPCFCIWTTSSTPVIPTYDSVKSKGIVMLRSELIFAASGLAGYHEFNLENGGYTGNNNNPQLFATVGRAGDISGGGTDLDTKFANWWTRASFFRRCKQYAFDSLVSKGDSTGVWNLKFKKPGTDSVFYAVWKGTINGSTTAGHILRFRPVVANADEYHISFTTAVGSTTLRSVVGNTLTVTVTEEPKFYFVQEANNVIPPVNYFIKKKKAIYFK